MMTKDEALQPLTDELIQRLVENHSAFRKFLSTRLPNEAIAEDLLQQSLMRAFEKRDSLESDSSVVAWFYQILRNALIDYYRAHASDSEKSAAYLRELEATGASQVAPIDEIQAAVCACLNRLLPSLKPEYAEVLRRVDLGGESLQALASELKTNANNLTVRLHRARQALKTSLERSCGTCTEHGCLDCSCE